MIKAVIFDLYGVLGLNGWQTFKTAHFSAKPEDWEVLSQLGKQVDGGAAKQSDLVDAVARATGESTGTVRYQLEHTTANEDLLDEAAKLKSKYKIGLLSNASHDVFSTIFSPTQLEIFDAIVSSYHTGLVKPDPRIFTVLCEKLDVVPEECVFIDDAERHLVAAKSLGMKTIRYESVEQTVAAIEQAIQQ